MATSVHFLFNIVVVSEEEINISVNLYKKMADAAIILRDTDQAVKFYKDALVISPNNCKILVCLAKLYMQVNILESSYFYITFYVYKNVAGELYGYVSTNLHNIISFGS